MTSKSTARDRILWLVFLAGPVLWLISFQAKFSWTPIACATQSKLTLLLFSVIAFVLSASAGLLAWRAWRSIGPEQPCETDRLVDRTRFMAVGAVVFCAGFCLVIAAQAIPDLIFGACQ